MSVKIILVKLVFYVQLLFNDKLHKIFFDIITMLTSNNISFP